MTDSAQTVSTTSTADAEAEKCPNCGSEEVYTVIGTHEGTTPMVAIHKYCDSCTATWKEFT